LTFTLPFPVVIGVTEALPVRRVPKPRIVWSGDRFDVVHHIGDLSLNPNLWTGAIGRRWRPGHSITTPAQLRAS
jgi:hypothetical protein